MKELYEVSNKQRTVTKNQQYFVKDKILIIIREENLGIFFFFYVILNTNTYDNFLVNTHTHIWPPHWKRAAELNDFIQVIFCVECEVVK